MSNKTRTDLFRNHEHNPEGCLTCWEEWENSEEWQEGQRALKMIGCFIVIPTLILSLLFIGVLLRWILEISL